MQHLSPLHQVVYFHVRYLDPELTMNLKPMLLLQPPSLIVRASQTLIRASWVRVVQHLSPLQQVVYFMLGAYIQNRQ